MDAAKRPGRLNERTSWSLTVYLPSLLVSFGTGMTAPAIPLMAASFGISTALELSRDGADPRAHGLRAAVRRARRPHRQQAQRPLGGALLTIAAVAAEFALLCPLPAAVSRCWANL